MPDVDTVVFVSEVEWSAYSMLDGRPLWSRKGKPGAILGWDQEVAVVQELRRMGTNRWIEAVSIATGERVWRHATSPPFMSSGTTIDGRVYTSRYTGEPARIEISSGAWEEVEHVPWRAGPGGWYGIRKKRLVRFDGAASEDVGPTNRLGLMGISGRFGVLARSRAQARELVLLDLERGSRTALHVSDEDHFVTVCGDTIVLSAVGRVSAAVGISVVAAVEAADSQGQVSLEELAPDWETPGVFGNDPAELGAAFLAIGVGIISATDGAVLVGDAALARVGGIAPRIIAWAVTGERRGRASLYGPVD